MKRYIIKGGNTLTGTINIDGSKNAALALIPATLLCKGEVTLTNVPYISDVLDMLKILEELNVKYTFKNNTLTIDSTSITNKALINEEIKNIRASYYFMGALLSLFKKAKIVAPGGCKIGNRPIDYHLFSFRKMGINIEEENDIYDLSYIFLNNTTISLPFPSVGATINLILASVLSENIIVIDNISQEPEVLQVIEFLKLSGAKLKIVGNNTLIIIGVTKLHGINFKVMYDRIEAGTYCILGALMGDNLKINKINKQHLISLLSIFDNINVNYKLENNSITFYKSDLRKYIEIETSPFPLFPTDLQQPLCVLATKLPYDSTIYEKIYYGRKGHIQELNKMGAKIYDFQNKIIIKGDTPLLGTSLKASDLRGGAALVIASLIAKGKSTIENIHFIERGYPNIIDKLVNVGANIEMEETL